MNSRDESIIFVIQIQNIICFFPCLSVFTSSLYLEVGSLFLENEKVEELRLNNIKEGFLREQSVFI